MRKIKDNEFELITRIREGDTSDFKILVDKYKDVSFTLACSILNNEQDAEDAVQDSFMKAFKSLEKFSYKSSFSTWFYKIVVNTCKTRYSYQKRIDQKVNYDTSARIDITENNTPFNELDIKERKVIVNRILDVMEPEESLLLRLFYLAELSIKEIKEITDFKESKIKVTLFRARKSFQQQLEKMYGIEITLSS